MIYGYARVSTDGQSVDVQVRQLTKAGCKKVFRETASGAKTDRTQLRKALEQIDAGDVLMVTRLDRLARSTRDLLNTLAAVADRKAGFRSLGDAWADTTSPHGRLMLTVLGGLADDAVSAVMRSRSLGPERWPAIQDDHRQAASCPGGHGSARY
jgi:DNA invertase Pin-like site-specific DNA recombinase